ncbi:MAG: hypothetical protein JXL97_14590, partial [Bacteroidales bacterium]|nr:hypothetical protein [Bacteroidales bacterium]
LSMVNRSGEMYYHLSGTGFYEKVENEEFYELKEYWNQSIISENDKVYRAEYLAYKTLFDNINSDAISFSKFVKMNDEQLSKVLHSFMSVRYSESYVKGIHDADAFQILKALISIRKDADLLRFSSSSRACAELWFAKFAEKTVKDTIYKQIKGAGLILEAFPKSNNFVNIIKTIETEIVSFIEQTQLFEPEIALSAAQYLFFELTRGDDFCINKDAVILIEKFNDYLKIKNFAGKFEKSTTDLNKNPELKYRLIKDWLKAFISEQQISEFLPVIEEATVSLCLNSILTKKIIEVSLNATFENFEGSHTLIVDRKYHFNFNDFIEKLEHFEQVTVVEYKKYADLKKQLAA